MSFAAAADELRAVGFVFEIADRIAFDGAHVRQPNGRFGVGLPAARGQQRADIGDKFRFDEQIGKCGMRGVGGGSGQADFGVGGDLDFARAQALVGDGNAAHLGVVFGGNDDVEGGVQRAVAALDFGAVFEKAGLVGSPARLPHG